MFKNVLLASALGLSAYAVGAADARTHHGQPMGWYVAVEGGANWIDDAGGLVDFGLVTVPLEAHFDTGWALLAEVGYRWETNWRLEFEAGYRDNDIACVALGGGPCNAQDGDVSQFTQMANVLYDIALDDRLTLSLGAGFGGDYVSVNTPALNDSEYVVAGQLIAGLNFALTDSIDLFVNYRYFIADDPHFSSGPIVDASFDDAKHTVTVGLRFDLDPDEDQTYVAPRSSGPMPAAPPPPPLGSPKRFIVFFGFNKSTLTIKAQRVVAEAVETAQRDGAASILVTGHTDTVGAEIGRAHV